MSDKTQAATESVSLDDRRPNTFDDFVGNGPVVDLIRHQMLAGVSPRRVFIYGPSGAGKTTFAHILVRYRYCLNRTGIGNPCMRCVNCDRRIEAISELHEHTGADIDGQWGWWLSHRSLLEQEYYTFFLDESQGLGRTHQKTLHRQFESAKATIILATTHRNEMDDALINRFEPNVFELRRPEPAECEEHFVRKCITLGLKANRSQVALIVAHYARDLRKSTNFFYAAKEDLSDGILTDEYIRLRLGISAAHVGAGSQPPRTRAKL